MGDLEHKNDYLHSSLIDEIICKGKSFSHSPHKL